MKEIIKEAFDILLELAPVIIATPVIVAIFFISLFAPFTPFYFLERHACYVQTVDYESRYGFFESCQIKHNGKWIQWDSYRGTSEDR